MNGAYYNEHEPFAAQWLRNLIERNLIAPGDVDERSIRDVQAADLRGYRQCHFFAGIGVWSHALRRAGWSDDRAIWTGSCPCQPFSVAGAQLGTADERHLWPEWFRLIEECSPPVVVGEQVAGPPALVWFDLVSADLERAGYAVGAADLCAAGVGAPHIRQRLYWVANSNHSGLEVVGEQQARAEFEAIERGGTPGVLAHSTPRGQRIDRGPQGDTGHAPQCEPAGIVGDASQPRGGRYAGTVLGPQGEGESERRIAGGIADELVDAGATGYLANADGTGCERAGQAQPAERDRDSVAIGPSANSRANFWSDCEWIPCSDGKARPIEPGTFPLASGIAGRVGRLRAYGNALCAPVAEEFMRAVMECIP